jgi:transposase-like protein
VSRACAAIIDPALMSVAVLIVLFLENDRRTGSQTGPWPLVRLEEFEAEWGKRYPAIGATWRRAWQHAVPFFAFAPAIRKMIYTTNAVEALHRSLRKIIKTRGSFPNDEAALKLLYLAIKNAGMRWRRGIEWTAPCRRSRRGRSL